MTDDKFKDVLIRLVDAWDHPVTLGEKAFFAVMREARDLIHLESNKKPKVKK